MESVRPQRVSVLDPIEPAIEWVRQMLFRPFNLSKWLIIGFCAWLTYLGQGGGGSGFNYNFPGQRGSDGPDIAVFKDAVLAHLVVILIVCGILIPLFIVIWLLVCWVSSRGQFMLVHCTAGNKAEVSIPWKKFSIQGNSLFLFRIALALITMAIIGVPCVIAVFAFIGMFKAGLGPAAGAGIVAFAFAIFAISVIVMLIVKFTDDFVVPIMFLRASRCLAGWREFLALAGANKARLALYILFQIVISMVITIIIMTICLVGCCCCCLSVLLLIPYVGTVILLPLFVFKRAYTLFYLRQYGPAFDVFRVQAT